MIGVNVAEKGVAWRRLRVRGTPGHGSMPFRIDNALVKAAAVVQRLAEYRPAPRFHELWRDRVRSHGHRPTRCKQRAARPAARSTPRSTALPNAAAAGHLHACTHTTFSPNLIDGGVMKTNVIPDTVELDVDIRTLPGEGDRRGRCPPASRARRPRRPRRGARCIINDPASISRTDTPLWDALAAGRQRPVPRRPAEPRVQRRLHRRPGVPRPRRHRLRRRPVQPARSTRPSSAGGSTATTSASTSSRSSLTTDLYRRVATEFLG